MFLRVVKGVEGVEELFLGLDFRFQELDVVDQQHVHIAVGASELSGPVVGDGVDEVVGEFLGGDVAHPQVLVVAAHIVPDGVQEVGFPQSGGAVDHQRVVRLAGLFRHGSRSGVREPVRGTRNEGFEGVARVQLQIGVGIRGTMVDLLVNEGKRWGDLQVRGLNVQRWIDHEGQVGPGLRYRAEFRFDLGAQLGLDAFASGLVGDRQHHGVAVHGYGFGAAQPGPGGDGDVADDPLPHGVQFGHGGYGHEQLLPDKAFHTGWSGIPQGCPQQGITSPTLDGGRRGLWISQPRGTRN